MISYLSDSEKQGLPKWPQMIVRGQPVTVEQAKEIIRRTDRSFQGNVSGNDRETILEIGRRLHMPRSMYDHSAKTAQDIRDGWKECVAYTELWGSISTEYVRNDWVSSPYLFGPHGWCHPDGTIAFDSNVGKYPGINEIAEEWHAIATAFPFLKLTVTLMDGENCEEGTSPVVTMVVEGGNVTVGPPQPPGEIVRPDFNQAALRLGSDILGRECGIPWSWIDEWGAMQKAKMQPPPAPTEDAADTKKVRTRVAEAMSRFKALDGQIRALKSQRLEAKKEALKLLRPLIPVQEEQDPPSDNLVVGTWECVPTNPMGVCVYDDENDPCNDFCLFCGHPDERK